MAEGQPQAQKPLTFTTVGSEGRFMAQRKRVSPCRTKTGRGIFLPSHSPQVTMEQIE